MRISKLITASVITSGALCALIKTGSSRGAKPHLPLSATNFSAPRKEDPQQIIVVHEDEDDNDGTNGDEIPVSPRPSVQCSNSDYHISNPSQLAQLYECDDVVGSIYISDYHGSTIDTGPVKTISGDFVIANASNLVRINTPNLAVIGGKFSLNELTSLTAVHAPYLNTVGIIDWRVLPILSTVGFDSGIKKVKSITISDTSLVAFAGFDSEILDTLNINNNRFLETVSTGIKGINEKLTISANSKSIMVSLPQLEYANNITIRDVASLDLSAIESVATSLELINNNFQSVKFPKLKEVGGTLSIIENPNLKDVEFPNVSDIDGGLMIVNNTVLNKLNFLPKLASIGGAIEFVGDFKEATFNKLKLVKGSAFISTVADSFDCNRWTRGDENSGSIIRGGKISCKTGGKQHTIKYDQDGEIVDEDIVMVDEVARSKSDEKNEGGSTKKSLMGLAIYFGITALLF